MANQYLNALSDVWNNGGTTFEGIKLNVTNSASAAGSMLLRLQVGAVDQFSVSKAGVVTATGAITSGGAVLVASNDGGAIGASGTAFSDLFLASGGVINWLAGDVTITHSANTLAFAGASSGYSFDAAALPSANDAAALGAAATSWADLFLASGAVLNFANGNAVVTHSSGILTVSTGDLRVTTAGTNAASAVTVGGTQTLTGKTLSAPLFDTTIAITGDITPAQITANQDDYAPTGHATASVFRLSSDAYRIITSLAGGTDGRIVILHNVGSFQIDLEDQSASGTAANRFITLSADWSILDPGGTLILIYDATASRWRVISPPRNASQSNQETATEALKYVAPATQHYHPSAAKCWGEFTANSTTILASYNITSVADTATGQMTVTIANDFSSANWCCQVTRSEDDMSTVYDTKYDAKTAGTVILQSSVEGGTNSDPTSSSGNASWSFMGMGDL